MHLGCPSHVVTRIRIRHSFAVVMDVGCQLEVFREAYMTVAVLRIVSVGEIISSTDGGRD